MAITDTFKKIKDKVIDVTSDVISAPARIKAAGIKAKADADVSDLKMVSQMKNVTDKGNYTDPLFRARANVSGIKLDMEKKKANSDVSKYPVKTQETIKKGLKSGNTRFEPNNNGGEFIYSKDKSFGSKPLSYEAEYAKKMSGKPNRF